MSWRQRQQLLARAAYRCIAFACNRSHNFPQRQRRTWEKTMRDFARLTASTAVAALLLACGATAVSAQTPEQFYKGRQLSMIVFSGPGSTYDVYARLLVRHLGNHIPGKPVFIVQNVQGAGGLKAIDYLN